MAGGVIAMIVGVAVVIAAMALLIGTENVACFVPLFGGSILAYWGTGRISRAAGGNL